MPPFFDTNVFVYFIDEDEPEKQEIARGLVEEYLIEGNGVVTVQVLRELYLAARRLRHPLSEERAREAIRDFDRFSPLAEDARMLLGAVRRSQELMLSFWDALIDEADRLLTDDMRHGQVIEGMCC